MSRGILEAPEEQHMYTNPDGEMDLVQLVMYRVKKKVFGNICYTTLLFHITYH